MALKDLTEEAIFAAIRECDTLGRDAFLRQHGFHMSRGYFLDVDGKPYDSKAIAGVAHGFLSGQKPLQPKDFSGGRNTVKPVLEALGFRVLSWEHFTPEQRARIYERLHPTADTSTDGESRDDKSWQHDESAAKAAIEAFEVVHGQGFMLSAAQKRAVELRAMNVAETALKQAGYVVKDTSRNSPFDLLATKGRSVYEGRGQRVHRLGHIKNLHDTERSRATYS